MWDRLELEGRLKRRGWRPWTDRRSDQFPEHRRETIGQRREREARRRRLNDHYHIT